MKVGRFPHCTCPDFAKGNICKHYLYVMIRVLRLRQDDPVVWQRALLPSEAEEASSYHSGTLFCCFLSKAFIMQVGRLHSDHLRHDGLAHEC